MPSRREFLAAAGSALLAPSILDADEKGVKKIDINETLRKIQSVLLDGKFVASAELHPVKNPKKGLLQWRWPHYDIYVQEEYMPFVVQGNRELLPAMRKRRDIDSERPMKLRHEIIVQDRIATFINRQRALHRDLIRLQFTRYAPFITGRDFPPSEQTIDREWKKMENIDRPVWQQVPFCGKWYDDYVSPLTRLGPGYTMHILDGLPLLATEHPDIDQKAEHAQLYGTPEEFQRWVLDERDNHFVKGVAASPDEMHDILLGYSHDLTDDVARYNRNDDAGISHLVLTVQAVADALELQEKQKTATK